MATTVLAGIGTLSKAVVGCTGNGVSPIVLTLDELPASVAVGQRIAVSGVGGNTNANGTKTITAVDYAQKKVTFSGTGGPADYTSGGVVAREYSTIGAWISATTGNLVSADEVRIGEMYDDVDFAIATGTALSISGATTDATRYRVLRAWSGHRYDHRLRSGVRVIRDVNDSQLDGIVIGENFSDLQGFYVYVRDMGVTTGTVRGVRLTADGHTVDSIVVEMSEGDSTANAWRCFDHSAGSGSTQTLFSNCIAIGSGTANLGAVDGFRSTILGDRCMNCLSHNVAGGTSTSVGIRVTGTNSDVRNCISVGPSWNNFLPAASFDHNISSDNTATGIGSFTQESADGLFLYPAYGDFRLRQSGHALNSGVDLSSYFAADILGVTRTGQWDIGPHDGFGVPFAASPTVVVNSIGSGAGRDYATIAAWETATRLHLVGMNTRYVGEVYDDSDFSVSSIGISNASIYDRAVTDATRYRTLRAASGHRYDPILDVGVFITGGTQSTLRSLEDYFRLEGVRLENTLAGTGDANCADIRGVGNVIDGVFASIQVGTAGARKVFLGTGASCRFQNCVAIGNTNTDGADVGFDVAGAGSSVSNCDATRIRRGASGTCFKDGGAGGVWFRNCIAGASDVGFNVTAGWQDHNASVDATAAGVGSKVNQTAASIWNDSGANDFRLLSSSACVDAGVKLASVFTTDITGATRSGAWEMGAYDDYLAPPRRTRARVGVTSRLVPCWSIEPVDGGALRFVDDSAALVHKGLLFVPSGSFVASNRRSESSLRESSLEISGPVTANFVTLAALQADVFADARVVESIVDARYPWLDAVKTSVYHVRGAVKFDSERWTAQLVGVASRLANNIGGVYTKADRYKRGDIDMSASTLIDRTVATVTIADLEFTAPASGAGSISGSIVDDWFTFGVLTWKSGANTGRTSEVRAYTSATRKIKLALKTRFPIVVGDAFDIEPGYDLSYAQRVAKFDDGINHRGFLFIPGGHRALQTPNR